MRRKIVLATIILMAIGLITGGCELDADREEDQLPTRGVGDSFKILVDDIGPFFELDLTGNLTGRQGYTFDADHSWRSGIDDPLGTDPELWADTNAEYFYQLDKSTAGIVAIAFGDDGRATGAKAVAMAKVRPGKQQYDIPLESVTSWINEDYVIGYIPGQYIDEPNKLVYNAPGLGNELRAPLTGKTVLKTYDLRVVGTLDVNSALSASKSKSKTESYTKEEDLPFEGEYEPYAPGQKDDHCDDGINYKSICNKFYNAGLMNMDEINNLRFSSREGAFKWNWADSKNEAITKCQQSLFYSVKFDGRAGSDYAKCLKNCPGGTAELSACKDACQHDMLGDEYGCDGSYGPDVMGVRLMVHRTEPVSWEPKPEYQGNIDDCNDYPEEERGEVCNAVYSEFVEDGVTLTGGEYLSIFVDYADVEANLWGGKLSISLNGGEPVDFVLDQYAIKPEYEASKEQIFDEYGYCDDMTEELKQAYCQIAYTANSFEDARLVGAMLEFNDTIPDGKIEYTVSLTDGYLWERKKPYLKQLWQGVDDKGYPLRYSVSETPLCMDMSDQDQQKYELCRQVYCGKAGEIQHTGFFYVESITPSDIEPETNSYASDENEFKFWEIYAPFLDRYNIGKGFVDVQALSSDYLYEIEDFDLSIIQGMICSLVTTHDMYELTWTEFNNQLFTTTANLRSTKYDFSDDIEAAAFYIDQPLTPGLFTFYGDAGWNIFSKAPGSMDNNDQPFIHGDFETTRIPINLTPAYGTNINYSGCNQSCEHYTDYVYNYLHEELEEFANAEEALENCEKNFADPYWGCVVDCVNLSDNSLNGCVTFSSCLSSCDAKWNVVTQDDIDNHNPQGILQFLNYCDDSPQEINYYSSLSNDGNSTNNTPYTEFSQEPLREITLNMSLSVPADYLENCVYRRALLVPPDSPDPQGCWTKDEIYALWSLKDDRELGKLNPELSQDVCLNQYNLKVTTENPCLYMTRSVSEEERAMGRADRELCCNTTYETLINVGVYGIADGSYLEAMPGAYEPVVDIFSEEDAKWDGTTKKYYTINLPYGPKMPLKFMGGTPSKDMQSQSYFAAFTKAQYVATGFYPPGGFSDGDWVWLGIYSYNWQKFPEYEAWSIAVVDTEENVIMGTENPYIEMINLHFGDLRALASTPDGYYLDPDADELI